jgi:hypothetical protein
VLGIYTLSRPNFENEDDDEYENEGLLHSSHLSFQPNHTERLETDLGLGESLGTEFEPNS